MKARPILSAPKVAETIQSLRHLYNPPDPKKQNPACGRGLVEAQTKGSGLQTNSTVQLHLTHASAEPLLARLDGVQKAGGGWRARCPACGGKSRKVSIAESDSRILVHCFGGCRADEVIGAVGLAWADLHPPRTWPQTPEEQRRVRRAIREAGWSAALSVLALESKVVLLAAREIWLIGGLGSVEDGKRLALAVERIAKASAVFCEADAWRPQA